MHYCTYHKTNHDVEEFGLTRYGVPKSWCRAACAEDNRQRYGRKIGKPRPKTTAIHKQCTGPCGQMLPINAFEERPDRPGKRYAKCPTCLTLWRRERAKAHYDRNQEQCVERARKYRTENHEKANESARKSASRPEARKRKQAYMRTYMRPHRAFVQDACALCGFRSRIEDRRDLDVHHLDGDHDNNDPTNLQTLCPPCHRLVEVSVP